MPACAGRRTTAGRRRGVGQTPLLSDDFTGTNGAAWNAAKWALGRNPSAGGGATISSNTGKLSTGSAGGYNNAADDIARIINTTSLADFELLFDAQLVGEVYPQAFFRSSSATDSSVQSYNLNLFNNPELVYVDNFDATSLAVSALSADTAVWYTFRLKVSGASLRARFWVRGDTEPGTWNIADVTNSSKTTSGYIGFLVHGGGDPASQDFLLDNVSLYS